MLHTLSPATFEDGHRVGAGRRRNPEEQKKSKGEIAGVAIGEGGGVLNSWRRQDFLVPVGDQRGGGARLLLRLHHLPASQAARASIQYN